MGKSNTKKDTRRKYTQEFKESVVKEHHDGRGLTELSKKYTIPTSTLGTWLANIKLEDKVEKVDPTPKPTTKELIEEFVATATFPKKKVTVTEDTDKDLEIHSLNEEIARLHEVIIMIKEEARKEINTLKDAILIMAKNHDNEI